MELGGRMNDLGIPKGSLMHPETLERMRMSTDNTKTLEEMERIAQKLYETLDAGHSKQGGIRYSFTIEAILAALRKATDTAQQVAKEWFDKWGDEKARAEKAEAALAKQGEAIAELRSALEAKDKALRICYGDSHALRVEWFDEQGMETTALAIRNIRKHSEAALAHQPAAHGSGEPSESAAGERDYVRGAVAVIVRRALQATGITTEENVEAAVREWDDFVHKAPPARIPTAPASGVEAEPMAWAVFAHKSLDVDYMVFGEEIPAQDFALEQEEAADAPEGSWEVIPLYRALAAQEQKE